MLRERRRLGLLCALGVRKASLCGAEVLVDDRGRLEHVLVAERLDWKRRAQYVLRWLGRFAIIGTGAGRGGWQLRRRPKQHQPTTEAASGQAAPEANS